MQPLFRLRSLIHRDLLLGKVNREKQVVGVEWSSKSLRETEREDRCLRRPCMSKHLQTQGMTGGIWKTRGNSKRP